METIVGVFTTRADAERASGHLQALDISKEHISLLAPCAPEEEIEAAPMMDTERPLMGKVLGGLAGLAVGSGGGLAVTGATGILLPGVGPIFVTGLIATGLLAIAGTIAGVEVGRMLERDLTTGVPKDDLFLYEDALRKGRTVLIALTEDHTQTAAAHRILKHDGAESIDAARENWWIGLRSAEEETYTARGGDFTADEPAYRRGFEAALHPETHGKSYDEAIDFLRQHDPDVYREVCFRIGYERGAAHAQNLQAQQAR